MAASLVAGPALTTLSNSISTILDVLVWVIVLGYVYFGWKLIFGPGGGSSKFGGGAGEWIKEKAGDAFDWHSERKEAGRKIAAAEQMALLEYDDLEKLKKAVAKVNSEESTGFFGGKSFSKLGRAGKAAKRHEAKANARLVSLEDSLEGDNFKELFTKKPALKAKVDDELKKMDVFNKTVIAKIKEFDDALADKTTWGAKIGDKKTVLIGFLDEAIKAERGLAATFKAIKDILAHELKKEPHLDWYGSKP